MVTRFSDLVTSSDSDRVTAVGHSVTAVEWVLSWFRHITPLTHKYQRLIIQRIIDNQKNRTTKFIKGWSDTYKGREALNTYFIANVPAEHLSGYIERLDTPTYDGLVIWDKDTKQWIIANSLQATIEQLKQDSLSRFECSNCLDFIPTLKDASIDVLMTDPPYGKNYKSNRRQDTSDELNQPIVGDGEEEALKLLSDMLALLEPKLKDNAHCYIFCDWKMYPDFQAIIAEHFTIKNLLIWPKNNHGSGDLQHSYAPIYECIIFGVRGKKTLQGRVPDVIVKPGNKDRFAKASDTARQHPTEKPVDLLEFLLSKSSTQGEIVCDPFAGVGSTFVAAKALQLGYTGCELQDKYHAIGTLRLNERARK